LQPAALAVIVVVPVHVAEYVTAPVAGFIVFPAARLAASSEYVIPVELAAVVVYVIVALPWHLVEDVLAKGFIVTVGIVVTVTDVTAGPLHPAALAVIVDGPVHKAVYVTAPVEEEIVFPPAILAASSE
jgi:hypothetical protein